MLFLRFNNGKADPCNFLGFSLIIARWLPKHQSSCLYSKKGEGGRENDSTYFRKTKDLSETVGKNFSDVTLARTVSDGPLWPKGVEETRLGNGVGSERSSDKCSFIYVIIFLVIF